MSEELYKDFDYQPIIDLSREFYGSQIPKGLNEEEEKEFLYNKARSVDETLPEYKKIVVSQDDYPSDPDTIDTSPETVNSIFNAMDDISGEQMAFLSLSQLRGLTPKQLEKHMDSQPLNREALGEIYSEKKDKNVVLEQLYGPTSKSGKIGSLMEGFVNEDSWMYLDKAKPGWKDAIKVGLNTAIPAMHYSIANGKDIYEVDMEKYNPTALQTLTQHIASMSDPISVLSFFGSYAQAGKFGRWAWQGLKDKVPSIFNKWHQKAFGNYVVKSVPKSKAGNSIKKKVSDFVMGEGSDNLIFGTAGFGGSAAAMAGIHSASNQRMNRGKYQGSNGTIKSWDVLNDSWNAFKDGTTTGFLVTGVGQSLATANIWGNASWKMGEKNLKTLTARLLGNPASKLGIEGTIFTAMPIALDDDVRKSYYDKDGNFKWKTFAVNHLVADGTILWFWGINKYAMPKTQYKYNKAKDWHTKKDAKIEGIPAPKDINFGKEIKKIQKELVTDIKHENNKLIDKNYRTNEQNMLQESIGNIKGELGLKTPFDFFDKDINIETALIETVDGLKGIREVVDNTVKILDKAGIKNKDGEYTGVDVSKLTEDDVGYLTYITPTAANAYQGYRLQNFETDSGRQEYIERYERENKVKLSDDQKKAVLKAQENRIKRYDILKKDLNDSLLEGFGKQEQMSKEKKSELDFDKKDVILVDEGGNPLTGEIISIDKQSANQGIEAGELKSVSDAKKKV